MAVSTTGPATAAVGSTTLTFGTVTTPNGAPVAGASVTLTADPVTLPAPGYSMQIRTIDVQTTDANGHYILSLPAGFSGTGLTDPDTGKINFDVIVHAPQIDTMSAFSAAVSGATPSKLQRTNFAGTSATTTTVDPSSEAVAQFTETQPEDPTINYGEPPLEKLDGDYVTVVKDYGRRWTAVGQWFSNATAVTGDFRYTSGADSELGIGVSATGKYGSFSAGGTQSQGWDIGLGYPTNAGQGGWLYRTRFHYKLLRYNHCYKGGCLVTYKAEPTALAGGESIPSVQNPGGMDNCNPYPDGADVDINYSRAITWTNGVNTGGAIGIDLSSRTGYTSGAHLTIHFNSNRRLCGRNDISLNPYILMARPRL